MSACQLCLPSAAHPSFIPMQPPAGAPLPSREDPNSHRQPLAEELRTSPCSGTRSWGSPGLLHTRLQRETCRMTGGGEFQRQGTRCQGTAAHSSRRGRTGGGRPHSTAELSSSSGTHGLSPTPGSSAALRWGGAGGAPGARQKTQPCRVLCLLPFSAEREAAQSRKGWLPGPCPIEWGQRATLQPPTPQPPAEQPFLSAPHGTAAEL